jgi:hypothetical protein
VAVIEDITKSIKAELYERATSPLLGAFLVSWPIWNYKAILVLLSNLDVLSKVAILEGQLYSSFWKGVSFMVVLPLASALAYLFLYPIPAKFVYRHARKNQKALKEIKVAIEDETPVTQSEYNQLRRKVAELEADYYSGLASKDAEIARLKAMLDEAPRRAAPSRPLKSQPKDSLAVPEASGQHPIITSITVAGERYVLGEDYKKGNPGQVNIVKLRSAHSFREKIPITLETSIPLVDGQKIKVFDGHTSFSPDELKFEIHKTDYEDKNAVVAVEQPNPLRDGKPIVISNKIQFAY